MRLAIWLALAACLTTPRVTRAGKIVVVTDPRYLDHSHPVVFPRAEVKFVTFEFESVTGDERGKVRAKELHDEFLRRIRSLPGGAIITYITPAGTSIANYRIEAERVAREQKADLALWGRIYADGGGRTLISARLALVELPPGVETRYEVEREGGVALGVISAPVTAARIDFAPVEDDVSALASFLEGLARYYKGAARSGTDAVPWLEGSIRAFEEYVQRVPEDRDPATLAHAHLYAARARVRLADAQPARASSHLAAAVRDSAAAARLNPYDAAAPTLQAVVAQRQRAPFPAVRELLAQAARLAPADAAVLLNLAMADAAAGRSADALRSVKAAARIEKGDAGHGIAEKLGTEIQRGAR